MPSKALTRRRAHPQPANWPVDSGGQIRHRNMAAVDDRKFGGFESGAEHSRTSFIP